MAAGASAVAAATSSDSLTLYRKISHLSPDNLSLTPILTTHFAIQAKPIRILKLRNTNCPSFPHFSFLSRSLLLCASAAFDSVEVTQDAEPAETEQQEEVDEEQEEEDEAVASQSDEASRLYVGNLPYSLTSSELAQAFDGAGRVVSVEIVYDRVTDRSRGFAFVTMGSVEEAKEAIRMLDKSQVGGRTVKVNFPEVPRGGERAVMAPKIRSSNQGFVDSPHKIYAGNLSWSLTSQGLRETFADQPGLLSAKVIYENSGRSRGFGFVTFESAETMESALNAMNGMEVEGRPLRLNIAEKRAPSTP